MNDTYVESAFSVLGSRSFGSAGRRFRTGICEFGHLTRLTGSDQACILQLQDFAALPIRGVQPECLMG